MPAERKNKNLRRYEPPSPSLCSSDEEERDKFFLENPDFEFDELPAPFKTVDKILDLILDTVNYEIEKVEELNELKRAARKVPVFSTGQLISCPKPRETTSVLDDDVGEVCGEEGHSFEKVILSMTDSTVYTARKDEIHAIDILTNKQSGSVALDLNAEITLLKSVSIPAPLSDDSPTNFIDLIFSFDSEGRLFIHAFNKRHFLLMSASEQQNESKVVHIEFCIDNNFFYLKRLNATGYIAEIYKIPKENWVQELVQAFDKIETEENTNHDRDDDADVDMVNESKQVTETEQSQEDLDLPPTSSKSGTKFSFSQINLLTSFSVPAETPSSVSNLYSLVKSVDLKRIGNGDKHPLTSQFFDILKNQQFQELQGYMPVSEVEKINNFEHQEAYPTVHFLLGTDALKSVETFVDEKSYKFELIGVWWSTKNKFLIYSLPKSMRDADKYQLEAVYPNSDTIFASSVSKDTRWIALALKCRNIVVWDRLQGTPSKILDWEDSIDYFLFGQRNSNDKKVDMLLIGSVGGSLKQISCGNSSNNGTNITDDSLIQQSDILQILVAEKQGWLVFVARSPNKITAFDLDTSSAVCQFQLPDGYVVDASSDKCLFIDANATKICVMVKKSNANQEPLYGIFTFCISTFCLLPNNVACHRQEKASLTSSPMLDQLMVSSMTSIRKGHKEIEQRQKRRWKEYHNELRHITQ